MRDYLYIRDHLDEYEVVLFGVEKEILNNVPAEVLNNTPVYVRNQGIMVAFYQHLIRHKMMSIPPHCRVCPFHDELFNGSGQLADMCCINTELYVGDLHFAHRENKPDWCPLNREEYTHEHD